MVCRTESSVVTKVTFLFIKLAMISFANRTAAQYCVMQIVTGLFVYPIPCVVDAHHKLKCPAMTARGITDALIGILRCRALHAELPDEYRAACM